MNVGHAVSERRIQRDPGSLKGDIEQSVKTVLYKKVHRPINILNSMIFKSSVIWKIMQAFEIELKVSNFE